jgi:hypothetical protein
MQLQDATSSSCSVIVWTIANGRIFAKAEQATDVHAGLFSFYDFWHTSSAERRRASAQPGR